MLCPQQVALLNVSCPLLGIGLLFLLFRVVHEIRLTFQHLSVQQKSVEMPVKGNGIDEFERIAALAWEEWDSNQVLLND